jgi:hypothetical protein
MPDRVFVFSTKGWNECPFTEGPCEGILPKHRFPEWGAYQIRGKRIPAGGFPHPQFANTKRMQDAIDKFRSLG